MLFRALVQFHQGLINVEKTMNVLRGKYGNIFWDLFVRLVLFHYVFYVSIQSFMICGRSVKEKVLSYMYYCIVYLHHSPFTCARLCLLANHLLLNPLIPDQFLHNSHSLNCSLPPITCYPIARLIPLNGSIVFCCPTYSLIV